jgi:hypothetical protein
MVDQSSVLILLLPVVSKGCIDIRKSVLL